MSLQSDNCNDITNSLLCTPIIWNHSEKNWNGISLRVGGCGRFFWRLDERIIVCPVPGNDGAWWTCIPPRRWPRPGWSSAWDTRPGSARDAGRQRIPGMPAIWPDPSSRRRRGARRSNRCRAACGGSGPPNCSARASARSMPAYQS